MYYPVFVQEEITEKKIYLATIEPRGVTMGHVFSVYKQDTYAINNDQLIAFIDIGFGGRAAEEVLHAGVGLTFFCLFQTFISLHFKFVLNSI